MDSGRDTVPLTPDGVPFPGITLLHTRCVSSNVCCWDNIPLKNAQGDERLFVRPRRSLLVHPPTRYGSMVRHPSQRRPLEPG